MIIEIKNDESSERSTGELCICEFQGEMSGELQGSELGTITITESGKAEIGIGPHQLEGQVVSLKLPFLVLEKRKRKDISSSGLDGRDEDDDAPLKILGIARKKILFKNRPKPRA